jgi:hypothetical protein
MATISKVAMLLAGAHFAALASPSVAFAQATPDSSAPITAPMPGTPAPRAPSTVQVHIEGSDVAELQVDTVGDHRRWVTVCTAPCDKAVSTEFSYRIAGAGIRNSKVFTLQSRDHEILNVDEGSKTIFVVGIVGASVGLLVTTVGLFVLLVEALSRDLNEGSTLQNSGVSETPGITITCVGLAGIIAGVVGLATNARTGVTQGSVSSPDAWLPPGGWVSASGTGGALRDAVRDARREPGVAAALPPMLGVPIFAGRF